MTTSSSTHQLAKQARLTRSSIRQHPTSIRHRERLSTPGIQFQTSFSLESCILKLLSLGSLILKSKNSHTLIYVVLMI